MRNNKIILICFSVFIIVAFMTGCATVPMPTEKNFEAPVITLQHVELEHYFGWWFYGKKVKPTKGKAGNNGAPLDFAFIFEISNPNPYPVLLDGFSFSVAFEEFGLNRVSSMEPQWIPAGKSKASIFSKWEPTGRTNQLRVHALFDVRPVQMSLLVTGGFKLKEKGISFWDQLEKWWTGAPNFSYPISANEGSAIFKANGITKVVPFNATFP